MYSKDGYLIRRMDDESVVPKPSSVPMPVVQDQFSDGPIAAPQDAAGPFDDLVAKLKAGEPWQVIRTEWLDPPKDAIPVDVRSDPAVVLAPASVDTLVCAFRVPDRFFGIFWDFGQGLTSPALFGTIIWTLRVNNAAVQFYDRFTMQTGEYVRPTRFPAPIRVKYNDIISVVASNPGGVPVGAFARIRGWVFSVQADLISKFQTL
jgi:hypothetical protein